MFSIARAARRRPIIRAGTGGLPGQRVVRSLGVQQDVRRRRGHSNSHGDGRCSARWCCLPGVDPNSSMQYGCMPHAHSHARCRPGLAYVDHDECGCVCVCVFVCMLCVLCLDVIVCVCFMSLFSFVVRSCTFLSIFDGPRVGANVCVRACVSVLQLRPAALVRNRD